MNLDQVHEGLAVPHALGDPAVLPCHPWALLALLDERNVIEDEETTRGPEFLDHPVEEAPLGLAPVPRRIGDELLDALVLGGRDPRDRGLHTLALAGEKEAKGVLEGASPTAPLPRGIAERAADADLLDVALQAREARALL